ncbi:hypothetical protein TWF696_007861 [Orbilia brochopaga]|uniref:F-box domain-containing protein n=1 Tax=Orbilia brochopaga TaxID=3140254 RepID=A0AAV9UQ52_9PEZI
MTLRQKVKKIVGKVTNTLTLRRWSSRRKLRSKLSSPPSQPLPPIAVSPPPAPGSNTSPYGDSLDSYSSASINLALHSWEVPATRTPTSTPIARTPETEEAPTSTSDGLYTHPDASFLTWTTLSTDKSWVDGNKPAPAAPKQQTPAKSSKRRRKPHQELPVFRIMELPPELRLKIVDYASITTLLHLFNTSQWFRDVVTEKFASKFPKSRYPLVKDVINIAIQLKPWAARVTPEVKGKGDLPHPVTFRERNARELRRAILKRWNKKLVANPPDYFKTYFHIMERRTRYNHRDENSREGTRAAVAEGKPGAST